MNQKKKALLNPDQTKSLLSFYLWMLRPHGWNLEKGKQKKLWSLWRLLLGTICRLICIVIKSQLLWFCHWYFCFMWLPVETLCCCNSWFGNKPGQIEARLEYLTWVSRTNQFGVKPFYKGQCKVNNVDPCASGEIHLTVWVVFLFVFLPLSH